jgi:hypothetical protein
MPAESKKEDGIRVSDWEVGRIKIYGGVNSISLVRIPDSGNAEYWVAEANENLVPGTRAIVSPLANVIGDGNDRVRISLVGNR